MRKKEQKTNIRLQDSIIRLRLSDETLGYLAYINVLTLSDLLGKMNLVKENPVAYAEIDQRLLENHIKKDSKIPFSELNERNMEREQIAKKYAQTSEKEKIMKQSISTLNISERTSGRLTTCGIYNIETLLKYNSVELYRNRILGLKSILELSTALEQKGLSLDIKEGSNLFERIEQMEENKKVKTHDIRWQQVFKRVQEIYNYLGHSIIPIGYKCDGIDLGSWICCQRKNYKAGKLAQEYIENLESIGIIWDAKSSKGKAKKTQIMKENGIEDIQLIDGEIVTSYKDGSTKSTSDLKGKVEKETMIEETAPVIEEIVPEVEVSNVDEIVETSIAEEETTTVFVTNITIPSQENLVEILSEPYTIDKLRQLRELVITVVSKAEESNTKQQQENACIASENNERQELIEEIEALATKLESLEKQGEELAQQHDQLMKDRENATQRQANLSNALAKKLGA